MQPHRGAKMKLDSTRRGSLAVGPGVPMPGLIHYIPPRVAEVSKEQLRNFPHSKRVGNYLLGRTLGEGSFAKVKEALHILTGEKVAVKVIDKKKAKEDAYVRKNMRREGKLLQVVRQKHVVGLYEIMETENSYYLVTELCRGGDLMDHICNKRRLDEREARRYIRQIITAVDYLHKAGILHRDLKVENLLLDENRDIKIIDFGLSNSVRVSHTKEGGCIAQEFCVTQCGSPAYAAPELLGNKKYGHKVDIWSIGVNMFAMLTGNLPFTVEPFNIKSLHNKMLKGEMNNIPEHLSRECKDLLKRFLTADPEKRISLQETMMHPWITEASNKALEPAQFPNKLSSDNLEQNIVSHMSQNMDFRLSEVVRLVTNNVPSSINATYNLFLKRLTRYNAQMRVQGRVSASGARLLCSSQSSQQTASTTVAPAVEGGSSANRSPAVPRPAPPTAAPSAPSAQDTNNNMPAPEAEESDDDEVIELNLSPRPIGRPVVSGSARAADVTDSNGNVTSQPRDVTQSTARTQKEVPPQPETVQFFRVANVKGGSRRVERPVREETYVIEDATPRSPTREVAFTSASPAVPRDLPAIVRRQATEDGEAGGNKAPRTVHQASARAAAPPGTKGRPPDGADSSESTVSSNGGRSAASGPGGVPKREEASEGMTGGCAVSDSSPRTDKQSSRDSRGSPKRYTIDIVHYERFARKGGVRMFPSVDGVDRSRQLKNLVYPTYHASKGKSYMARQFMQRTNRPFSKEVSALNVHGVPERTGRMTALLRASLDNSGAGSRRSDAEDGRVMEVNIGCRTAMEQRADRRGPYLGLASARTPRVELPSISPSQLKGKDPA